MEKCENAMKVCGAAQAARRQSMSQIGIILFNGNWAADVEEVLNSSFSIVTRMSPRTSLALTLPNCSSSSWTLRALHVLTFVRETLSIFPVDVRGTGEFSRIAAWCSFHLLRSFAPSEESFPTPCCFPHHRFFLCRTTLQDLENRRQASLSQLP
jgi:hypothetical protein